MRKRKHVYLAAFVPAIVTPAVLFLPKAKGNMFGMSPQFWGGFTIGLAIVLAIAAIASLFINKRDS